MYFLFKIVLFLVSYHECYFEFIEFEYYMKLFVWVMKTMVFTPPPPPPPPSILGGDLERIKYWIFRGGGFNFRFCQGGPYFPGGWGRGSYSILIFKYLIIVCNIGWTIYVGGGGITLPGVVLFNFSSAYILYLYRVQISLF